MLEFPFTQGPGWYSQCKLKLLSKRCCAFPQVIDITFDRKAGPDGLLPALKDVCDQAQAAVEQKYAFIVLSDRYVPQAML